MIFIVIALWMIAAIAIRKHKELTRKQSLYLFVIMLCAGITLRTILFMFGM